MKSFLANVGIGALFALSGVYAYHNDSDRALALLVAAIVTYQLHRIEQHVFNQTALMVQDEMDDSGDYPNHPPYPIDTEDDDE